MNQSSLRVFIYRILGNDMPPLQSLGQTRRNVAFTLANEPQPPSSATVERRWMLNRVVDPDERAHLRSLLAAHGQQLDEPFRPKRHALPNISSLPASLAWRKTLPATNQNAARNAALRLGAASGATWVLPLDGQVFITSEGWLGIIESLHRANREGRDVYQIPMVRLNQAQDAAWLNSSTTVSSLLRGKRVADGLMSEPQLGFRIADARRRRQRQPAVGPAPFNDRLGYGVKNKLEALERLCPNQLCECGEVAHKDRRLRHQHMDALSRRCGAVVRLWFWPTDEALRLVRRPSQELTNRTGHTEDINGAHCHRTCLPHHKPVECILRLTNCRAMLRTEAMERLAARLYSDRNQTF